LDGCRDVDNRRVVAVVGRPPKGLRWIDVPRGGRCCQARRFRIGSRVPAC